MINVIKGDTDLNKCYVGYIKNINMTPMNQFTIFVSIYSNRFSVYI